ncbi:MAG: S-adenosylmethionine:tRNA ribosyltransferase-isomerase, partial [Nitrospirales bacterium]|nr:S-adenosylmethionine:tRNA ribosyltransferase-isomerase [Nitrospirales bacterium]
MRTTDFDFVLPKELIALQPSPVRDHSRLLVLGRDGSLEHRSFHDIVEYLAEGDMLLLNDTKVFPARIVGSKPSGGTLDLLLVREVDGKGAWEALFRGKYCGGITVFGDIRAEIWREAGGGKNGGGELPPKGYIRFPHRDLGRIHELLWRHGSMPLPPYIKRKPRDEDKERYQTVYAKRQGSIAAPTAGL